MQLLAPLPLLLATCVLGRGRNSGSTARGVRRQRWVESKHRPDYGKFQLTAGKFYKEKDKGPDIYGFGNNKVQVILRYQGKYHENKKTIKCRINKDTHLYTLIIRLNATYEVKIDNQQVASWGLEDDRDFLPPRWIKDPYACKARKWDERLQIEDPEDKKPEVRECLAGKTGKTEYIPDPDAKKPDDWNEAMDGEWEGLLIPNLKYQGQWKPRIIDNPNYWGHRFIQE
ncbi:hypothetical protein CB1_000472012 [Camelus ferus]|nr:hypothetical protein CB1_000472012 [Camelus ferus]